MSRPHWKERKPAKFGLHQLLISVGKRYRVVGTPDTYVLGHGYAPAYALCGYELVDGDLVEDREILVLDQKMVEAGRFEILEEKE